VKELLLICLGSIFVDNLLLSRYLGLDTLPDEAVNLREVARLGLFTTLIMVIATPIVYLVESLVLAPFEIWFGRPIVILLVIAATVRLASSWIRPFGSFSVINSGLLGLALLTIGRGYGLFESLVYALGSGLGLTAVLLVLAGISDELRFSNIPESFRGVPMIFIVVGILALCLGGFCGMIKL